MDFKEILAYGEGIEHNNETDLELHLKKMDVNGNSVLYRFKFDLQC